MFHFNNLNTMMKKINKYGSIALLTITVAVFTSCSDQFLEDKKLYGSFNGTTIYENYESADNLLTNPRVSNQMTCSQG